MIEPEILSLIEKELRFTINFYPHGKPYYLHSFLPGSNTINCFDIFSTNETRHNLNFACKDYASFCYGPNDKILYTGGWDGEASKDTYLIDIATYDSLQLPQMNKPRYQHSSICLSGYYYVFGGVTSGRADRENGEREEEGENSHKDKPTRSCERWNGRNWEVLGCKPSTKMFMYGICEHGGKVYLTGRQHIEVFDEGKQEFYRLDVRWEKKLLNIAINAGDGVIIFRGGLAGRLDSEGTYFIVSPIRESEWWSSSPGVSVGNDCYFYVDSKRTYYSYNYTSKRVTLLLQSDI